MSLTLLRWIGARMRWMVLLLTLLLAAGCGFSEADGAAKTPTEEPPCSISDGRTVYSLLNEFALEWDDARAIAGASSRMTLAGPVGDLQAIRRDVQRQEWPDCAATAHKHLIDAMDETIDGFIAFMAQKPDTEVGNHFKRASEHQETFFKELRKLR